MTAGRPPKPTHLKLVTGTLRKNRANKSEPKPPSGVPRIPAHLNGYARAAWLTYAPMLAKMGVLTMADALALERLCGCYGEVREADDAILVLGLTGLDGKPRAEVAMRSDADRRLTKYLSMFGLSPSDRSKVKGAPDDKTVDPGAKWMDGG